jgi:hypothetical protein
VAEERSLEGGGIFSTVVEEDRGELMEKVLEPSFGQRSS